MQTRSQPARSRDRPSTHACTLMEQHEILDAMHTTMARSYLDLEMVLEDLILVMLSIRFYIRIVAFCIVLMTLFAFALLRANGPSATARTLLLPAACRKVLRSCSTSGCATRSIAFDSSASIAWGIFATSCLTSFAFWECAA